MFNGRIVLTPQDIFEKDFKIDTRGYRLQEVDKYLDQIIKDYVEFIRDMDLSYEIDTPYILVDGDVSVLLALKDAKINYILYSPLSACIAREIIGMDFEYTASEEAYKELCDTHSKLAFRHIMCDYPVDKLIRYNTGIIDSACIGIIDILISDPDKINSNTIATRSFRYKSYDNE